MARINTTSAYLYSSLAMLVGVGILTFNRWQTATTTCHPSCPGLGKLRDILIPLGDLIFLLGFIGLICTITLNTAHFMRKKRIKK